jgi:hypothetical protein
VTGHDDRGKAVFVSDEAVGATTVTLLPGFEFHRLWGGDGTPQFPDDGSMPSFVSYFPPIGGFRFWMFTLPPAGTGAPPHVDRDAGLQEFETRLPGLAQYLEPDDSGMHTTPTIDFELVVSGEVILELDDGATVTLAPGDTVVQNGTRHRWRNPGSVPAVIVVFICGARHGGFQNEERRTKN